ncbi:response regulator [Dokdonia sp. Hel_I_53]|uniref:response regulator n=1 Tax=Dokdonia sp. Hel_I_53 TaxID=1566287 RepID=UPI0016480BF8|nr:response regulator [Dokdonia sp. Hel_I_53]
MYFICVVATLTSHAQIDTLSIQNHIEKLIDSSAINYSAGNYVKSLSNNIAIVENAEKINDFAYLQKGYRYLGYDYLILEDLELARVNFQKAQQYAQLIENDTLVAETYMDLANLFSNIPNDYEKAIRYHNKSITLFKKIKDSVNLGKAYYNTIITLYNHEQYNAALPYLKEANKLIGIGISNYKNKLFNQWAEYYIQNKNYNKVDFYLKEVLKDTLNGLTSTDLADTYEKLSFNLYNQKLYKEAYESRVKFEAYEAETLENIQNASSQNAAASFQVDEYKKNIERKELKNQLQQEIMVNKERLNNFLTALVIACVLLLILFYTSYKNRKVFIKKLTLKNQEYLLAKEKSEELSKSKSAFFSTVSHELRTPLYGVIGLSTILLDNPELKSHEQDIKSLKFSADYLLALINDVLQISKIDSKLLEENEENFNVREFIKNIVSSFEYMRLQNKNIINIDIDSKVPRVLRGDATRLSQILMNLIGNALKFTDNGIINITIDVKTISKETTTLKFSIADTGIGIPESKLSSIFNEFSQVNSRHYTYQGTGLGLPIVKKLLALSNSKINVESEMGVGSVFFFTLELDNAVAESRIEPTLSIDEDALRGKRILIVDDNRINQIVTTKILQKSDVLCQVANNGEEAIAAAKEENFDLILMDINMPVMNGMEATEKIREFDNSIPIIALTAVEVKEMRTKIYESGMTDIIVKPYDISKFKRTIIKNVAHIKELA